MKKLKNAIIAGFDHEKDDLREKYLKIGEMFVNRDYGDAIIQSGMPGAHYNYTVANRTIQKYIDLLNITGSNHAQLADLYAVFGVQAMHGIPLTKNQLEERIRDGNFVSSEDDLRRFNAKISQLSDPRVI